MPSEPDLRQLCGILADAEKHAEWLFSRGYQVFGGSAWKIGQEHGSVSIATALKREAEAVIVHATWEADQKAAEADDRIVDLEAAVEHWKQQSFRPLGDNHHNAALCPHCGETLRKTDEEIFRLMAAIRTHHSARGHDRCWENDVALYLAAGLEPGDPQLPPREEFRRRCQQYEAGQYGDTVPVRPDPATICGPQQGINHDRVARATRQLTDALADDGRK